MGGWSLTPKIQPKSFGLGLDKNHIAEHLNSHNITHHASALLDNKKRAMTPQTDLNETKTKYLRNKQRKRGLSLRQRERPNV